MAKLMLQYPSEASPHSSEGYFYINMNPTTSADALGQLTQYQGSLQTPQQAMDAAKGSLGVNGAQQTATGLRGAIQNTTNLLNQVAPSVYGRTGNSLVTSAQATRQVGNESAPLQQTLTQQGTQYDNAEKDYEDLLGQAENQASNTLTDQQGRLSGLQSIYQDLYGKEQDAAKLAEQQREFDQQLAASKASSSSGLGSALGSLFGSGSSSATGTGPLSGGMTKDQAATAVQGLLRTNNAATIANTFKAISTSAKNGNTYDQAKLQLLQATAPGIFKNGQLNTTYLQNTLGKGMKLFT